MARIRTIKPAFFTSRSVSDLPPPVRLTFIGLWTYADDRGRAEDDARLVKAALWPLDDKVTAKTVSGHLDKLERDGFICRYEAAGKRLLHICSWDEHQRINRPQPSRLPPAPCETHPPRTDDSVNAHGSRTEHSRREGNGMEEERNSSSSLSPEPRVAATPDDDEFVSTWDLIADRRIGTLAQPPDNPRAYRRTVLVSVAADHRARARDLTLEFPGVTTEELADMLEPPAAPQATAEEPGVRARRERDELLVARERTPCPHCDAGFRWGDGGDVVACESCGKTGVAAHA